MTRETRIFTNATQIAVGREREARKLQAEAVKQGWIALVSALRGWWPGRRDVPAGRTSRLS